MHRGPVVVLVLPHGFLEFTGQHSPDFIRFHDDFLNIVYILHLLLNLCV